MKNEMPNEFYESNYLEDEPNNYWSYLKANYPTCYMSNYMESNRDDYLFYVCMKMQKLPTYSGYLENIRDHSRKPELHPITTTPKFFWPVIAIFAIAIPSLILLGFILFVLIYCIKKCRYGAPVQSLQKGSSLTSKYVNEPSSRVHLENTSGYLGMNMA